MDKSSASSKSGFRAFYQEWKRLEEPSLTNLIHGIVYAKWPYLYIGVGKGDLKVSRAIRPIGGMYNGLKTLFVGEAEQKGDYSEGYHGKVVPTHAAKQLVSVNEEVQLRDLESIIPYPRAKDIILKNPDHIVALQCPCRSSLEEACTPLDVCLIVGEPFASFVRDHHPDKSRWITKEEAEGLLESERDRGHVHHAFFKDAMLNRFYAICNCCPCCCGAMKSFQRGVPMLTSSGFVSTSQHGVCIGCGTCVDSCPFGAMVLRNSAISIIEETCMGCGICVSVCPEEGLMLERAPAKGEPLEILSLLEEAQHFESEKLQI